MPLSRPRLRYTEAIDAAAHGDRERLAKYARRAYNKGEATSLRDPQVHYGF